MGLCLVKDLVGGTIAYGFSDMHAQQVLKVESGWRGRCHRRIRPTINLQVSVGYQTETSCLFP